MALRIPKGLSSVVCSRETDRQYGGVLIYGISRCTGFEVEDYANQHKTGINFQNFASAILYTSFFKILLLALLAAQPMSTVPL